MPIYLYKCGCGYQGDHVGKVDDKKLPCPKCRKKMTRQFHSHFGINMGVGAAGYFDENLGCYIGTNAQKKRVMQEQGVQEKFGKGWR
jgi:putative FmdB family regulatory protein